ncbi:BamA/TamA family outer membrane protein [Limnobacter humi]|uniref:BamA/TamA family outer membrane protein n=1 Tax=Limnobacter humi TaxID=1778671 RepID=A0ABT1WIZ9_9BURK|nr:BamA/TamA family outer membrane protein [Limnobacter humi]MCQ8897495.1 BamA/TamA family outer membrane protein [Limnobacter humi]
MKSFVPTRLIAVLLGVALLGHRFALAQEPADIPEVRVTVPAQFEDLIQNAMAPIRRSATVNDEGDVWQLFRRLRPVLRDALGTRGYFSPVISRVPDANRLIITIDPGPPSVVTDLQIEFDGAINEPQFAERRERLKTLWLLGRGQTFDQAEWTASKDLLLRDLLSRDFAAATLAESSAQVDPETHSVVLRVVYDSGPVFTFGPLQIEGLNKYRPDLIERYNTIEPGDRYEQEKLLTLLSDLQNTSYFSGVDVKVDTDDRTPTHVPIQVSVQESDSKRLGLGAGYSSNTGFRTEASYQFNNLWDKAYTLSTGARLEQKRQSAYADLFFPPSRRGVVDSLGIASDHQTLSNLEINRNSVGGIREYRFGSNEVRLGLNYQQEERQSLGVNFGATQALVSSASWTHNRVNDRLNPSSGYIAYGQVAAASEQLASDQDFVRLYGRVQRFWSPSRQNLFSARLEAGTVAASARRDIPQDYLFRAGGTNSLRGFEFLDIGVLDQGILVGGRRLMIGSLEYTRWFKGNLGAAVFTDVGDVADNWSQLDLQKAVGVGLRYKTPAGPIALDVAKAVNQPRVRIHFSLGVAF